MVDPILKLVIAQINPVVGDIDYNVKKITEIIKNQESSDIIIFPEMALVGYPIMDHIHDPLVKKKNLEGIEQIKGLNSKSSIIIGTFTEPKELEGKIQHFYNSAILIENNKVTTQVNKRLLPNYDVFDERRYFAFDDKYNPTKIKGFDVGILICEDIWDEHYETKVAENLVANGAEILIVINASPYHIDKFEQRAKLIKKKSKTLAVPIVYVNMVGGLDEIVYDGQSFITNKLGQIIYKSSAFKEDISRIELNMVESTPIQEKTQINDWRKDVIEALKLNLYDYYHKSNIFDGVVLGLSGGIDSAFTAYICSEALGSEKVTAIMMPTRFTSKESLNLAENLCKNLNINYKIHPIDKLFEEFENNLKLNLGTQQFDIADENLQARIRANILMYYSNKFRWLLVSTGNKSEIGVGFCTLYGDTCGGKNIPGDLLKVQIYNICDWINIEKEIIPKDIIERPPTAELRNDQKDSDSIPPYEVLDVILEDIFENGISFKNDDLNEKGITNEIINKVRSLYLNSEYKRRQLVQTIKVSKSAFGVGRRYPVLKKINF